MAYKPRMDNLYVKYTSDELLRMNYDDATEGLTERQITFCEHYCRNKNLKTAALRAGYKEASAHRTGWGLRANEDAQRYIAWMKIRAAAECHLDVMEVIDHYMRIAFADITDFVEIKKGRMILRDGERIDGQLVNKIKNGKDGISLELVDKLSALQKLEKFFDIMPSDWKQQIEERKIILMEKRLEFEKAQAGLGNTEEEEDDGFLDALKDRATTIWEDEENDDEI